MSRHRGGHGVNDGVHGPVARRRAAFPLNGPTDQAMNAGDRAARRLTFIGTEGRALR